MHRLVLLVVTLVVVVSFVGCQQSGLSEEEVRSIVREEVTRQLASGEVQYIVGEVASIDRLTVSELFISNSEGEIVGKFDSGVLGASLRFFSPDGTPVVFLNSGGLFIRKDDGEPVANLCRITFESGAIGGTLSIFNPDGKGVASLSSSADGDGYLSLNNSDWEQVVFLGADFDGGGQLNLYNAHGERVLFLGSDRDGDALLNFWNSYEECIVILGGDSDGNGSFHIFDKYGRLTFVAP